MEGCCDDEDPSDPGLPMDPATFARVEAAWWRDWAREIDSNWAAHHEACLGAIRRALGLGPDASVPEACEAIRQLRARAQPQ